MNVPAPAEGDRPTTDHSDSITPVAVIDVGTASIRMAIAEIGPGSQVRPLERLSQAVSLGRDTFTRGVIEKSTIEECVRVLKSYRRVLQEYQIVRDDQIRIVATSAVREAGNRMAFLDRVYSATGMRIESIDESEVNRITYLGIQPFLRSEPSLAEANTVVIEVGGGSTELLLVQHGEVAYSRSFRLGALRLRQTLDSYRAPAGKVRSIMENQIRRTIEEIVQHVPREGAIEMIALGGDIRFAVNQILPDWDRGKLATVPVAELEAFTDRVLAMTEDRLLQQYHLTYRDAEMLGPALLAYLRLADELGLEQIQVTNVNLRDGLLTEMAHHGRWTDEFFNQILRSALNLGRKFDFDEHHAHHVAELCKALFRALRTEHRLDLRYELILYIAALLHEIGLYINYRGYHKHSMYLILNSELFGLGRKDVMLVAMSARYHRRASPKPTHDGYASLNIEHRIAVSKMAAILRVADALDDSRSQRVRDIDCRCEDGRLVISVPHVEDLSMEQLALKQKGTLFEEIFGMQVLLRTVKNAPENRPVL